METIAKIRRRYHVKNESVSEIAEALNLCPKTVRKYLHQEEVPRYERSHQPKPRLGDFEAQLREWLEWDAKRPKRERRTARRLFTDLQGVGYLGAYDSVQRFVKGWKTEEKPRSTQAFVPLQFPSGETGQFDWSHEGVVLDGKAQVVKLAHFRLAYSRQMFLMAFPRETQEMVFEAHVQAFLFFGGVPERMIYDNLKAVVDAIVTGKERRFNRRFLALANHYLFEPVACTPASGWEKGQVENQVGNVREWLFSPRPAFAGFEELNAWLRDQCQRLAQRKHPQQKSRTIAEVFAEEQANLRLIERPFDGYVEVPVRVSATCTVSYDRNRYSVPTEYAGQRVSLRATSGQIRVVHEEKNQTIACHDRHFGRDRQILDPWHYLPLLERKPGALRNGAPFQDWKLPTAILQVRDHLLKQPKGDRAFVDVLLALRDQGSELVTVACELALEHRTLNTSVVLNHVHRLANPQTVRILPVADNLVLNQEPLADCARYDHLRGQRHER
jgi:transposase